MEYLPEIFFSITKKGRYFHTQIAQKKISFMCTFEKPAGVDGGGEVWYNDFIKDEISDINS